MKWSSLIISSCFVVIVTTFVLVSLKNHQLENKQGLQSNKIIFVKEKNLRSVSCYSEQIETYEECSAITDAGYPARFECLSTHCNFK